MCVFSVIKFRLCSMCRFFFWRYDLEVQVGHQNSIVFNYDPTCFVVTIGLNESKI